jgi:hypothetical protein
VRGEVDGMTNATEMNTSVTYEYVGSRSLASNSTHGRRHATETAIRVVKHLLLIRCHHDAAGHLPW